MLWPCLSEIDDGLSLAGQYAGRAWTYVVPYSTFCIAFCNFVVGKLRDFKIGTEVDCRVVIIYFCKHCSVCSISAGLYSLVGHSNTQRYDENKKHHKSH